MLAAVEETAEVDDGPRIVRDPRSLRSDRRWLDAVQKLPSKVCSRELVELVFTQPYCKIQFLVEAGIAKRQTSPSKNT